VPPELQALADNRRLGATAIQGLPGTVRTLLDEWLQEGWAHWDPQP
jgi:hypothetical protein